MLSKRTVDTIQFTTLALPEGYEIRVEGFQKVALYFNGELLNVFSQKRYASNAAQRHSMGQSV